MLNCVRTRSPAATRRPVARKGAILPLAAVLLVVIFAFVAFSVDTGILAVAQTNAQNAADAAALAASLEIVGAIHDAGAEGDEISIDANSIAVAAARLKAQEVAAANGAYIDPQSDVIFGKRTYDAQGGDWDIQWNTGPYNIVKVQVRRTNDSASAPDAKVPLSFGWAVGMDKAAIQADATAFLEARDIAITLDFSGSMNDDSTISAFSRMGQSNVESNLDGIWSALVASNVTFPSSTKKKFPSTGFGQVNSAAGTYKSSTNSDTVYSQLGLGATDAQGKLLYPFPQQGKNGSGVINGLPSSSTSKSQWKAYISYVMDHDNSSYRKKYGYRTLIDYLLTQRSKNNQSEDLWRTPHYPFQSLKDATGLFCDYLDELDFDDQCGLAIYATTSRVESSTNEDGVGISLGTDLITPDRYKVKGIVQQRQAAHYDSTTNIGGGILEARGLLEDHCRFGARKTIVLVTDGLANERPSNWSLPAGFDWSDWTDWDGNGTANFTISDKDCQYAFYQATQAIQEGITIHTVTVGVDADDSLMEAIAKASGGIWIDVPGGTTVDQMESQMRDAFAQIASRVPPPKLIDPNQ